PFSIDFCGKTGRKAEEAQYAQMIFCNTLLRVTDKAYAARRKVCKATKIVVERRLERVGIEGVDGKIAAGSIGLPVVGKNHLSMPAIGPHVLAQSCHFIPMAHGNGCDGSM